MRDNTHENGNADYYDDDNNDWQRWWQPTIEIHKNNGDKCSPLNWMWFTLSLTLAHTNTHMKVPWFFLTVCISFGLLFSKHHMAASEYTPKSNKKKIEFNIYILSITNHCHSAKHWRTPYARKMNSIAALLFVSLLLVLLIGVCECVRVHTNEV